jgi:predicted N-acetyltransferase YhbS
MRVCITEFRPEYHMEQGYKELLALLARDVPFEVRPDFSSAEAIMQIRTLEEIKDLVAIRGKEVVGCISLWIEQTYRNAQRVAKITDLIVREDCRRQGIGTKLVNAVMEEAKDNGCRSIVLQSTKSAIPFYQALGFIQREGVVELSRNVA